MLLLLLTQVVGVPCALGENIHAAPNRAHALKALVFDALPHSVRLPAAASATRTVTPQALTSDKLATECTAHR